MYTFLLGLPFTVTYRHRLRQQSSLQECNFSQKVKCYSKDPLGYCADRQHNQRDQCRSHAGKHTLIRFITQSTKYLSTDSYFQGNRYVLIYIQHLWRPHIFTNGRSSGGRNDGEWKRAVNNTTLPIAFSWFQERTLLNGPIRKCPDRHVSRKYFDIVMKITTTRLKTTTGSTYTGASINWSMSAFSLSTSKCP